jgi:hypothetical protein
LSVTRPVVEDVSLDSTLRTSLASASVSLARSEAAAINSVAPSVVA